MNTKNLLLSTLIAGTVTFGGLAYADNHGGGKGEGCKSGNQKSEYSCSGKQEHQKGKKGCRGQGKMSKGKMSGEKKLKKMTKRLGLTEEQQVQVKALMDSSSAQKQAQSQQMGEIRTSLHDLDPSAANYAEELNKLATAKAELVKAKMIAHGEKRQKMHNILTPEQRAKMKEMREKKGKK